MFLLILSDATLIFCSTYTIDQDSIFGVKSRESNFFSSRPTSGKDDLSLTRPEMK